MQHVSSKHEYLLVCGKLKVWKLYIGCQSDTKQEYIWPCMTNNHVQWMVLIVSLCLQCLIVACMWPGTWQAGWLDWLKFCVCRLFPEIWCSDNRPTYTIADEPLSLNPWSRNSDGPWVRAVMSPAMKSSRPFWIARLASTNPVVIARQTPSRTDRMPRIARSLFSALTVVICSWRTALWLLLNKAMANITKIVHTNIWSTK